MSATTIAQKGIDALAKGDYATAITNLDKALESSNSPVWLLARSKAHQKAKNLEAALHDAELAYHAAAERGSGTSRSHMIQAQYRRAVIYYQLERFADADCCAKWSMLLAEGRPAREDDGVEKRVDSEGNYTVTYEEYLADKDNQPKPKTGNALAAAEKGPYATDWNMAFSWRSQALGRLKKLPKDHPGWKVNVTKIPPKPEQKKVKSPEPAESTSEDEVQEQKAPKKEAPAPGSVPDEKMKLRVDFYQTNQTVTVSLFVKDVKKEDLKVEFGKHQVSLHCFRSPATAITNRVRRFGFPLSFAKPHLTSSPVTEKPPRPLFSPVRSIPRPPSGPLRHARLSSSCRRPHLVSNGVVGATKRLAPWNPMTKSLLQQRHHLLLPQLPSQLLLRPLLPQSCPPTPRAANLAPKTGTAFLSTTTTRRMARISMAFSKLSTRVVRLNSSVP